MDKESRSWNEMYVLSREGMPLVSARVFFVLERRSRKHRVISEYKITCLNFKNKSN